MNIWWYFDFFLDEYNFKILECVVDSFDWNDVVGIFVLWWKDWLIVVNIVMFVLFYLFGWNFINEGIVVNLYVVFEIFDIYG